MIDEKILLRELDEMIKIQQKSVERAEQGSNEAAVYLESRELAAYMKVRNLIKEKSAHGAATPTSTLQNRQKQYNTDQKKSEIRELVVEVFDLSLRLQEMTDGTIDWIDWRKPGVPCVQAEYHGATAVLSVRIWENGFNAEQQPDYSTMLFLDNRNCINEAKYLKEKLMGLLEERRGSDNGKDDSDHN